MQLSNEHIAYLLSTAREAAETILDVYSNESLFSQTEQKADASPLTLADQRSHAIISKKLSDKWPELPVLSEEGRNIPYDERKDWSTYWCVDPLDGTKEFIKRNGEFAICIALMKGDKPLWGLVYLPVGHKAYYGGKEYGAWRQIDGEDPQAISVAQRTENLTAVGSRSHKSEEEEAVLAKYPVTETLAAGSALKFCKIAEGSADIYYRHGPTMEWDTAAGQALLEGAGGQLLAGESPMRYNKESLRNDSFLCLGWD
jgi:3'(2'), 5'-bisphosphate nucleotidase